MQEPQWEKLQVDAKKQRVGLWADSHPIPPWEYRQHGFIEEDPLPYLTNKKKPSPKSSFNQRDRMGKKKSDEILEIDLGKEVKGI